MSVQANIKVSIKASFKASIKVPRKAVIKAIIKVRVRTSVKVSIKAYQNSRFKAYRALHNFFQRNTILSRRDYRTLAANC